MPVTGQWHLVIFPCPGCEAHLLPACVEVAAFRVGCSAGVEGAAALGSHLPAAMGASSSGYESQ